MKKRAEQFLDRSINSLILSIEVFNRPYENGRAETVLILLDHALEMLMKAIIYEMTNKIRKEGKKYNYSFKKCIKVLKDRLAIINEDQAMILNTINDLRDIAMHHIIDLSEDLLYLHSQSGVTLFDDLLRQQFSKVLKDYLPSRVLPISTNPPTNIEVFFDKEFSQIMNLIAPGKRRVAEATARVRPFIVLENNISRAAKPTTDYEIRKILNEFRKGKSWRELFPGTARLRMDSGGTGLTFSVRLTRDLGLPVRPLKKGEDPSKAIIFREVDLLDRYSLSITRIAKKLEITVPKACALVEYLNIQKDEVFFKEFIIGKQRHKRYSPNLVYHLKQKMIVLDMDKVWKKYRERHYGQDEV